MLDEEIRRYFPGAHHIETAESTVIKIGKGIAVHIYPPDYPREAIDTLAKMQNWFSRSLRRADVRVRIGGKSLPVRATPIIKVDTLPRGRVFTNMRFDRNSNLERLSPGAKTPTWARPYVENGFRRNELTQMIDKAIVKSLGSAHVPEEYRLSPKNIHIGRRSINIVDVASDVKLVVIKSK